MLHPSVPYCGITSFQHLMTWVKVKTASLYTKVIKVLNYCAKYYLYLYLYLVSFSKYFFWYWKEVIQEFKKKMLSNCSSWKALIMKNNNEKNPKNPKNS